MKPFERLYHALSYKPVDRVPFLPKVWVDLASRVLGTNLKEIIENPNTALRCVPEAACRLGLDGARMFQLPRRRIVQRNEAFYELNNSGDVIGTIDMQGGLGTVLNPGEVLRFDDPYISAHRNFWIAPVPLEPTKRAVRSITVPKKKELHDMWGDSERRVVDEYQGRTALIGDCSSATMAFLVSFRGMEQAIFDLYDHPEFVHALMEKGVEIAIEKGKFHCDMGIRILRINDSVGNLSVLSPPLWREFIYPHLKTVCGELRRYEPDIRIYCHICGDIELVLEDLAETGIDCIGPMDPLGKMSLKRSREIVGTAVALMGGINTLSFIHAGQDEIIEEARTCIAEAGKQGFVLGSGCAMPRDSMIEHITAIQNFVKTTEEI